MAKMDNPCYDKETKTDCPKRYPGCGADCPKWAKYVVKRDAEYERRHRETAEQRNRISNLKGRKHQEKRYVHTRKETTKT